MKEKIEKKYMKYSLFENRNRNKNLKDHNELPIVAMQCCCCALAWKNEDIKYKKKK